MTTGSPEIIKYNLFKDIFNKVIEEMMVLINYIGSLIYNIMIGSKVKAIQFALSNGIKVATSAAVPAISNFATTIIKNPAILNLVTSIKTLDLASSTKKITSAVPALAPVLAPVLAAVPSLAPVAIEPKVGGQSVKYSKLNKTKINHRIHHTIKHFHKTNNLKSLKSEIHKIKQQFTRRKI